MGGGGAAGLGGGGGGGVTYNASYSVTAGSTVNIYVGSGGQPYQYAAVGGASQFGTQVALGGGYGCGAHNGWWGTQYGRYYLQYIGNGGNAPVDTWATVSPGPTTEPTIATGGGGGCATGNYPGGFYTAAGSFNTQFQIPGGTGATSYGTPQTTSPYTVGGGGGGAGGNASEPSNGSAPWYSGNGGAGVSNSITGTTLYYGAGGNGGNCYTCLLYTSPSPRD